MRALTFFLPWTAGSGTLILWPWPPRPPEASVVVVVVT